MTTNKDVSTNKSNLHSFTIKHVSSVDDKEYVGTFTVKKLSVADMAALGTRKSQLNGGMYFDPKKPGFGVDSQTDELNAIIAHLDIALKSFPKWWDLSDISDIELIYAVYSEVINFETSFRSKISKNSRGADKGNKRRSEETNTESDAAGTVRAVVSEEVSDPLEP